VPNYLCTVFVAILGVINLINLTKQIVNETEAVKGRLRALTFQSLLYVASGLHICLGNIVD
jgi:hypothetical protein